MLSKITNQLKTNFNQFSLLTMLCVSLMVSVVVNAQQLDANRIKAAYMINFIKHISWPNEVSKNSYRIAIYKDKLFYQFLLRSLTNKIIKGKAISVIYANNITKLKTVDVVYVPAEFNQDLHKIANALRGHEILLVSDASKEKHDVMINLNHQANSTVISFEINKSNIVYEKLQMSNELLLLGGTELDVATLYRETEVAMQKTRDQDIVLKMKLSAQKKQLANSKWQLQTSKKQLTKSIRETRKQKIDLKKLKHDVIQKQNLLTAQEKKLANISTLFKKNEQRLIQQQQVLAEKEQKNQNMLQRVEENKEILTQQNKLLEDHRLQLEQQDQELVNRNQTINSQQAYILITTILVAIAVFVSLLVVFFFIKNKKTTYELTKTLTYLENTQEQLIQSEKMASLGALVAGVAHEINTPLSIAITSNSLVIDDTQEVKQKITEGSLSKSRMDKHIEKVEESLSMSEKALERVKILLANFKQVAADQVFDDLRELNLAEYIEEVMMTLSVEMKKNHITYQFNGETTIEITTLPGALAQILTNLVNNSIRHGFENKEFGNITISLRLPKKPNDETTTEQQYAAQVIYHDDGVGMNTEVLKNIYEPFFTTKRNKGNTGLGMNIVYNIINQKLKGEIKITSELGAGATFVISLPKSI
ncbi:MAG: hypothetical protein COB35_11210 [Gammaproteobacteria bacterium]|nr:MAG: hypothetical protein COB35_11210 [Gammaproteobacteria bacterium]